MPLLRQTFRTQRRTEQTRPEYTRSTGEASGVFEPEEKVSLRRSSSPFVDVADVFWFVSFRTITEADVQAERPDEVKAEPSSSMPAAGKARSYSMPGKPIVPFA